MKRGFLQVMMRDGRGTAAAEMALVTPLLLILMCGSAELGNYFMNEHSLDKAVRDGARFAARQGFANYAACSGSPGGTVADDTKNVVMHGYLDGSGALLTPNITTSDVSVTTSCATSADGQPMSGIYKGRASGAQIVTVKATVNYQPILGAFGFTGTGMHLNATSEAVVTGL
jgi:hypothetical protein